MSKESFPKFESEKEDEISEEKIEDLIGVLLKRLPEEIAERFQDSHQLLGAREQYDILENLITKRREALEGSKVLERDPGHVEVVETNPLAVVRMLERVEGSEHIVLGAGKAGRVIASVRHPNICYKVMLPSEVAPIGTNEIAVETDLQEEIAALGELYGVRAPRVFSFIHDGEVRAITMERLNAVSLRDVLQGKEKLPESFDADVFFDSLRKFMINLNNLGYFHRDFHDGNVMIDLETSNPYVIDFGMSTHSNFPEDIYRVSVVKDGQFVENVLQSDLDGLDLMESKLRKFITT